MFRGLDNTFGSKMLINVSNKVYEESNDEMQFALHQLSEKIKFLIKNDLRFNLLCEYEQYYKQKLEYGDVSWGRHILQMMMDGTLYMGLAEIPNWAYGDVHYEKNIKNLEHLGISISKSRGNSDGLFEMNGEFKLYKLDYSPIESTSLIGEDIIILKNPFGVVEFGTQKICKSAATLMMNNCLLRVPYNYNNLFEQPVCAIFFNTEQFDVFPDLHQLNNSQTSQSFKTKVNTKKPQNKSVIYKKLTEQQRKHLSVISKLKNSEKWL